MGNSTNKVLTLKDLQNMEPVKTGKKRKRKRKKAKKPI